MKSALALVPAFALLASAPLPVAGETHFVTAKQAAMGVTLLSFATQPRTLLKVSRDKGVPSGAHPEGVVLVGRLGDKLALVVDRYRSRLNQGQGACGAGQEQFLRVIRLHPMPAKETYRIKLASCWDSIEPDNEFGRDGLRWSANEARLEIRWLFGPSRRLEAETRTFLIAEDAKVQEVSPD